MKLKTIDGEQYLDRKVKVFFQDDVIPEEFQDKTEWDIVIIRSNRPKKPLKLYEIQGHQLIHQKDFYTKEELESYVGANLQEHFMPDMTKIVLHNGGFIGCFSN